MDTRRPTSALGLAIFSVALAVSGCTSSHRAGPEASAPPASPLSATAASPTELTAPITVAGPFTSPSTPGPTAIASTSSERAQQARDVTAQLMATFAASLPPGAQQVAHGPSGIELPLESGPINLVQSAQWFAVPLTQDAVLAYVAARAPAGLARFPGVTSIGVSPYVDYVYSGEQTATYDAPIVQVLAAPDDGGETNVWINVYMSWRPVRSPAEFVALTVSGATAVSAPGGDYIGATLHLDQAQAQRVAELLDGLDTQRPNAPSCMPGSMYTIAFDETGQTFSVGGCSEVTVHASALAEPALADDAPDGQRSVLDTELDTIFGREVGCSSADILSPTCAASFQSP
jgi:hypothetical protein